MNRGRSPLVPAFRAGIAAALFSLIAACVGQPDPSSASDPLVVTEAGARRGSRDVSPERAAAIVEMRARAEAGENAGFPGVFQSQQTNRLAAREEPRSVFDAEAIELELAALAKRRQGGATPGEIAALEARAAELRRLARRAQSRAE